MGELLYLVGEKGRRSAALRLRKAGYRVLNEKAEASSLRRLRACDGVALAPGHSTSLRSEFERSVASAAGMTVKLVEDWENG